MLNMGLAVSLEDGTTFPDVNLAPGDFVRFERHFGIKIGQILNLDDMSMEQMLYLAWSPLHRRAQTGLDFDSFCDQVSDLNFKSASQASPTPPAPSEDDSSS